MEQPSFNRLWIAYTSYVLVKRDYLIDWNAFTVDVIKVSFDDENDANFEFFKEYTKRNLDDQMEIINNKLGELKKYGASNDFDPEGYTE